MWTWIRRICKLPSTPEAINEHSPSADTVKQHDWGEVDEWVEGDCRSVQWTALVQSWEGLEPLVDQFVVASLDAVTAAYPGEPVPWMVLRYDPLRGTLSVVPAAESSWDEGGERVYLSFKSFFLERQAERTYYNSPDGSYAPHYKRVWTMVRKGLQVGESGHKLATARALHPLQIAVFNSPTGCDDEPVEDWDEPPYGLSDLNKNKADGSSVVD